MITLLLAIAFIVLFCIWLAAITDDRPQIEFILDAGFFDKYDVLYTQQYAPEEQPPVYFMMSTGPRVKPGGANYPTYYNVIQIENTRASRWWAKFVIFCNNY